MRRPWALSNAALTVENACDMLDRVTNIAYRAADGVTLALSWNTLGKLVSVSTNGAFAESYLYDALGRRVSTTSLTHSGTNELMNFSTVYHVYDGDECVADGDGSVESQSVNDLVNFYRYGGRL